MRFLQVRSLYLLAFVRFGVPRVASLEALHDGVDVVVLVLNVLVRLGFVLNLFQDDFGLLVEEAFSRLLLETKQVLLVAHRLALCFSNEWLKV